jgi:DNA mismatch repair ATPase MutS
MGNPFPGLHLSDHRKQAPFFTISHEATSVEVATQPCKVWRDPVITKGNGRTLQASVVNREMVAVVTRGTMTDAEMLSRHPDASFLLALAEAPAPAAGVATSALHSSSCRAMFCAACLVQDAIVL